MLNIILVTPLYQETAAPAGLCTAALANAFIQSGHRVHVICSMTIAPRPRHEHSKNITIHRLETRRASHPLAFAIQAARRIHELIQANQCDAIECIDAPDCVVALAALRQSVSFNMPLIEISVENTRIACELADASITANSPKITPTNIPFPLNSTQPSPSSTPGPLFIACDAIAPEDQQTVLKAYKDSNASSQGWSLALYSSNGSWFIHERTKESKIVQSKAVYLAVSNATPIAAIHARHHRHPCIIANHCPLASEFPSESVYNPVDSHALAGTLQKTMLKSSADISNTNNPPLQWEDTHSIVQAHEQLWSRPKPTIPNRQHQQQLTLWRTFERHASTIQEMETVQ